YGNVKYLYDAHGNLVAEYTYRDPWGGDVELTCHYFEGFWIAELNPFTYKGYYYDADLQMYYCGSRYYDPETCRWINADGYVSTGQGIVGNNMYAYCGNNPVMYLDLSGTRYCAAGSVKAETAAERKVSCEHTKNALVESSQTDYPTINPNQPNNTTEADMTPMEKWKKEGVEFKPNTNGEGGKLINSYKITDYFEMYEYASYLMNESEYAGNFEGSVVGFVYEWEVHNIAYDFYTFIGDYESVARAKDLDVGRTIFSDNHIPLGSIMQASYWLIQPSYAMSDFLIHSLG
ncbi:MAG: RHS repeat-associated core domain-containing protein, partial [Clostridia bacterium]|nr:RHS repeat-associated core domain-containing protein [Clostridia bacterium]